MLGQLLPYILPMIITAILLLVLAVYAFAHRGPRGVSAFGNVMLVTALWVIIYGIGFICQAEAGKIFWAKLEFMTIIALPVAWLLFAVHFTNHSHLVKPYSIVILLIGPVITASLVWTNELHWLVWQPYQFFRHGELLLPNIRHDAWFWVHTAYSYLYIVTGSLLIIRSIVQNREMPRQQSWFLVIGLLFPFLANALYLLNLNPFPGVDLTPFAFSGSGILLFIGIFRFRLFDIVPVAHREVIQNMRAAVMVIDDQNQVMFLNNMARELLEIRDKIAAGKPLRDLTQHHYTIFDRFEDTYDCKTEIEVLIQKQKRYFDLNITALYDFRDRLIGRLVTLYDITERKQFENSLQRRDTILATVAYMAETLLKYTDFDSAINDCLEKLGRNIGVSRTYLFRNRQTADGKVTMNQTHEWVDEGIDPQIDHPELQNLKYENTSPRLYQFLSGGQVYYGNIKDFAESEKEFLEPQGIISIAIVPIFAGDEWCGYIGFDDCLREREWTELEIDALKIAAATLGAVILREKSQTALDQTREKLLRFMESATDGFILLDENLQLVEINPAALQILRIPERPPNGTFVSEISPLFQQTLPPSVCEEVLSTNMPVYQEEQFTPSHSSAIIVGIRSFKVAQGLGIILSDITDRKRSEEELQRIQKLESVSLMASGIAHDFNNYLSVILGNAQLGKLRSKGDVNVKRYLNNIEKVSHQASTLTNQLLFFSKEGEPVRKICQIDDIIRETVTLSLSGSNVLCEYELPEDLWPANIDKGQITQVFSNILINADQAMPSGGTITITARNTDNEKLLPPLLSAGKYVCISIRDEGIGIPESIIRKIFDPYFTTKQKGNGLGLATSYSIIQKHQGTITVSSIQGEGTTFQIFLPATEAQRDPQKADAKILHSQPGHILVMDNDASMRETLADIIAELGHSVETVADGESALQLYRKKQAAKEPFDCVILDLTVPGGKGAAKILPDFLRIDPHTKAILCTGYTNNSAVTEYRKLGFTAVIAKPYDIGELGNKLAEIISTDR